jgi:hypothetical protein
LAPKPGTGVDIQCCCIAELETIARERPLASTAGDAVVTTPGVIEYQVRQADHSIDAAVVADGTMDHSALASSLRHSLHAAGLREPSVHVHQVPCIARHPRTGKTRRLIPR